MSVNLQVILEQLQNGKLSTSYSEKDILDGFNSVLRSIQDVKIGTKNSTTCCQNGQCPCENRKKKVPNQDVYGFDPTGGPTGDVSSSEQKTESVNIVRLPSRNLKYVILESSTFSDNFSENRYSFKLLNTETNESSIVYAIYHSVKIVLLNDNYELISKEIQDEIELAIIQYEMKKMLIEE